MVPQWMSYSMPNLDMYDAKMNKVRHKEKSQGIL